MDVRVRFQKRALNDLERLVRYIAQHDAVAAERFGFAVVAAAKHRAFAPENGKTARHGTRRSLFPSRAVPHLLPDPHRSEAPRSLEDLARDARKEAEVVNSLPLLRISTP
jgi:plasmid stabilization system protein ParE